MKINYTAIVVFSLCMVTPAFGQQAVLEGHVYEIVSSKKVPVQGLRVIGPGAQSAETDVKGHFIINFPDSIKPGYPARLEVNRPGWQILDPLYGECTTKDPTRNLAALKVVIVPKGSPLALETEQLSRLVERDAKERVMLHTKIKEQGRQLYDYALYRQYAEMHGISLDQLEEKLNRWAQLKDSDKKIERARKEYWNKNYAKAASLAGVAAEEKLKEYLRKKKDLMIAEGPDIIRDLQFQGDAFYAGNNFREAAAAYGKIDNLFTQGTFSKDYFQEEWIQVQRSLGESLSMSLLMDRGPQLSPEVEIVTRFRDRLHRTNYGEVGRRARQLANALKSLGVQPGDRIGSFGWNTHRHLELYYAVPSMGAILHTLNLRLSPADLEYIINHAEDRIIFIDEDLLPLLERLAGKMPTVKQIVVMSNTGSFKTVLEPALDYESLLAAESSDFVWPALDEDTPMGLCYTSGTTGKPKGVLYTHRSNYLHTITGSLPDLLGLDRQSTVLAVVPMFHANAWGMPFTALMLGIKQVYPGAMMDGASICQLIQDEKVTFTAGVPTIWLGVMNELRNNPGKYDMSSLRTMVCGGSAPPRALIDWFETNLGIEFIQAWGMTETSPLGTVSRLKHHMRDWPREKQLDVKQRAGMSAPGLELRIVDAANNEVPHDGVSMGRLLIRGPWIASSYYLEDPTEDKFPDGWLDTGDVATIDGEGYMAIADRSKDLIKSGGEWISSVDLENAIMAIPGVAEAAVIAVFHPKWQERPLACVVTRAGATLTREEILAHLEKQFAKWWLPDEIVFIETIPKTSVGKFDKKVLRQQFANFELPG